MSKINQTVQVFYACDEAFLKYTAVSLRSLIDHASPRHRYCVHILYTDIGKAEQERVKRYATENFEIRFDDVTPYLQSMKDKLPVRDYYTKTTYFRLFIAEMYPQLNKAVYLDSDTVVLDDIAKLYFEDIGDCLVGACVEQAMAQTECYGSYVERAIGIPRNRFFNAGVLLINCRKFRKQYVLEQFIDLLNVYQFVVTQDEDYLNVICKGYVHFLHPRWNVETYGTLQCKREEFGVIHYIMVNKPWHYRDCMFADIFWEYASKTDYHAELEAILASYTDRERERDAESGRRLAETAERETNSDSNFLRAVVRRRLAPDRLAVLERIEKFEREGKFDIDVEEDPPAPVLLPDQIEYLRDSLFSRIRTGVAFCAARIFVNRLLRKKQMIIKEIRGIENFDLLEAGAVITCNHFNAFDSFAMQLTYDAAKEKNHTFYRVIREGNYTGFPGFYGFLMRNCNTLPLSSNSRTMRKFIRAVDTLLQRGDYLLIYPEQSMWWNYRKPKPLKSGGFSLAAKNRVPILPCFITMQDSTILGPDGFFVQEYTVHVGKPIYPDSAKKYSENVQYMMEENERVWKEIYEREYGLCLTYDTDKQ